MAKALKVVAVVATVAALAVVTGGAAVGLGISLATSVGGISAGALMLGATAASLGASLLSPKPKAPQVSSANADRLTVSIDVRAPRKAIFGRTAMATDLRDQEYSADQTYLHRFVVVASHKVHAFQRIFFDDKLAWTSTGGVTAAFAGYLEVTPVLEGSAANAINIGPRMGSSRRYTGCAYVYFRYRLTGTAKSSESPFAQTIPSRVTIIGEGMYVYDPRLDSTRGGSGPCRAHDQSTWVWTDAQARNPALQWATYRLGWRINGLLAVGKGMPPERIDWDAVITAANICDESVARSAGGTEPRYRGDGIFSEADDLSVVDDTFKASMNALIDDVGGRQRLLILHNDLGAPVGHLDTADVLGDFTWEQTPALQDTVNVLRGSYTDPSDTALYQLSGEHEVRIEAPDGIDRPQRLDYPFVESSSQVSRLDRLRLQRMISGAGTFSAEFQATAWRFVKGDLITFTFAPLGWVNKKFRIADMTIAQDGRVPMILREEHPDIYLGEGNDAAPIVGAAPTTYDWQRNPLLLGIGELGDRIDTALEDIDVALDTIEALGDDGVLTANEKITKLIPADGELDAAWELLDDQAALATGFDPVAEARAAASSARGAWIIYRNALSPAWNNTSLDTAVVRGTFNGKLADYRYGIDLLAEALRQYAGAQAGVVVSAQPEALTIAATAAGVPHAGQLPRTIENLATQSGEPVAITGVAIVSASGCTATVSGDDVVITAVSAASGSVSYDVTALGQTARKTVTFTLVKDGGGGSSVLSVPIGTVMAGVYLGAGETISLLARVVQPPVDAYGTLTLRIEASPSGANSWAPIGAEEASDFFPEFKGTVSATGSLTNTGEDGRFDFRAVSGGVEGLIDLARSFLRTA